MPDALLRIHASELTLISEEIAASPDTETGGALLGLWSHGGNPVVFLASRPGARAHQGRAFFQQDPRLHMDLERLAWERWGLQVVGLWHSHHRLQLEQLSERDVERTVHYARQSGRARFCEILGFLRGHVPTARPYVYRDAATGRSAPTRFLVLPGTSPLRATTQGLPPSIGDALSPPAPGPLPALTRSTALAPLPHAHERALTHLGQLIPRCVPPRLQASVQLSRPHPDHLLLVVPDPPASLRIELATHPQLSVSAWQLRHPGRAPLRGQPTGDLMADLLAATSALTGA